MNWFRCTGGNSGGDFENHPYLIFSDGQWLNDDIFDVTISATGASNISISNGYLIYDGTTGISVHPVDTTKQFAVIFEYDYPAGYSYVQSGRCALGADAKRCQNEGYQRYSYHGGAMESALDNILVFQGCSNTGQSIFFSGSNLKIKRIYGQISSSFSCYGS